MPTGWMPRDRGRRGRCKQTKASQQQQHAPGGTQPCPTQPGLLQPLGQRVDGRLCGVLPKCCLAGALTALGVFAEQPHHCRLELVWRLDLLHSKRDVALHLPAGQQGGRETEGNKQAGRGQGTERAER